MKVEKYYNDIRYTLSNDYDKMTDKICHFFMKILLARKLTYIFCNG